MSMTRGGGAWSLVLFDEHELLMYRTPGVIIPAKCLDYSEQLEQTSFRPLATPPVSILTTLK